MTQKLGVGETFYLPNPQPNTENCHLEFTSHFVDLVYYILKPQAQDIETWRSAPLRLAVFEAESGVPFVAGEFQNKEKWSFDAPVNVLKVATEQPRWWQSEAGSMFNMILVNAVTNKIVALRQLSVQSGLVEKLSNSLVEQSQRYQHFREVDAAHRRATIQFSTLQMLRG
ncbi:hypothetical protein SAMN06265337_1220 [Hymenobacter gelipurpurascens]|uniref:Uncharacterized protein n=1 Tax=Hymenobacter gelipurpurascens TaxID=89968 RepID=A0A212TGJ1_9BACT|nr:hypothetical protein [Hymenobacter gelipurpurascens]SNC65123.1 hypothetical protein SAMN06265337_1220 [Hymenobacter gelipurpurascens]